MNSAITITLKNYRCFADTRPATIEFGPGFTAFAGPNNSGKSSYLKFIYEFQQLWQDLRNVATLAQLKNQPSALHGAGLRSVVDNLDVLCDQTGRPLSVELHLKSPALREPYISSIILTFQPANPTVWQGAITCAPTDCNALVLAEQELRNEHQQAVSCQPFLDSFSSFHNCLFAPAFRNAINEGAGSYYELAVGTSLVALWDQWKAGDTREAKKAIQRVTKDIRHIFGFASLEINASANGKTLEVVVDGRPYRLNDLGAGLSQFVILFANVAIKRPSMILLDEPELNLHPSLQIDFLTSLASYTTTGCVMFATHSLGLARAVADRVFTFTPTAEGTVVTPFERTPNYAEFAGELSFSSFRELGFATLLLVEGPSEVKAVQQFLRLLRRDHEVVVLHLGGSSTISAGRTIELAELKRITTSVAVLIDSERAEPRADLDPARTQFIEDCGKLGFRTCVTDLRAFENYFPDRAIKTVFGEKYRALAPYERLKDLSVAWGKADNWRIAREMAKDELLATDIGKFLDSL